MNHHSVAFGHRTDAAPSSNDFSARRGRFGFTAALLMAAVSVAASWANYRTSQGASELIWTPLLAVAALILALAISIRFRASRRQVPTTDSDTAIPLIRMSDVGGLMAAKRNLNLVIDYLQNPELVNSSWRVPHSILLYGPAHNGKARLAQAMANEATVPFLTMERSTLTPLGDVQRAAQLHGLFATARRLTRSHHGCLVFIDDLAAIAGAHRLEKCRSSTCALMAEMRLLTDTDRIIFVASADTLESLDPQFREPGSFNRVIHVPMPGYADRYDILNTCLAQLSMRSKVDIDRWALGSAGLSARALSHWVLDAAVEAARDGVTTIADVHFERARRRKALPATAPQADTDANERSTAACHEVGHAIVCRALGGIVPSISLRPGRATFGPVAAAPLFIHGNHRRSMKNALAILMAGRAGEQLTIGKIARAADSDFIRAKVLAEEFIRCNGPDPADGGRERVPLRGVTEDQLADAWVREAADRAFAILADHRALLVELTLRLELEDEIFDPFGVHIIEERYTGDGA